MLKRGSGIRHLPIVNDNNNEKPLNVFSSGNNIIPNVPVTSSVTSTTPIGPSPAFTRRSVSPAIAKRSVRRVTLGTKHTANVRNTVHTSHPVPIGKQTLEPLRVMRRNRHTRRNRR